MHSAKVVNFSNKLMLCLTQPARFKFAVKQRTEFLNFVAIMTRRLLGFLLIVLPAMLDAQTGNAGLGTTNPDPSAKFDIVSNTQGFLMPRMSSAEREAIVNPAAGLMVYDTNSESHWYFNGSTWINTQTEAVIPSQLIFTSFTQSSLLQAAEGVLGSYVIPPNTLNADGQALEFHVMGQINSDSAVIRLKFSGESLVFPVNTQGPFDLRASLYRTPSNTYKCSGMLVMANGQNAAYLEGFSNFSLSLPFQLTAEQSVATPNGVVLEGIRISRIQ